MRFQRLLRRDVAFALRRFTTTSQRAAKQEATELAPQTQPQSTSKLDAAKPSTSAASQLLWKPVDTIMVPLRAYDRASKRRPYTVQICSSVIIYFLGDFIAQYIQKPETDVSDAVDEGEEHPFLDRYSFRRSLKAITIGGIFSLPSYHWFIFLSMHFNVPSRIPYSFPLSILSKIVIQQLVFAPLFSVYFFGMQSILSTVPFYNPPSEDPEHPTQKNWSRTFEDAGSHILRTIPPSWTNSCKFWPFVTAFSFTFVPMRSRSVFGGVAAIFWQTYLSLLNQWEQEKRKQAAVDVPTKPDPAVA